MLFLVDLFLDKNATEITNGLPDLQLSYLIFPQNVNKRIFFLYVCLSGIFLKEYLIKPSHYL